MLLLSYSSISRSVGSHRSRDQCLQRLVSRPRANDTKIGVLSVCVTYEEEVLVEYDKNSEWISLSGSCDGAIEDEELTFRAYWSETGIFDGFTICKVSLSSLSRFRVQCITFHVGRMSRYLVLSEACVLPDTAIGIQTKKKSLWAQLTVMIVV